MFPCQYECDYVCIQVLKEATMMSITFWDIAPCSLVQVKKTVYAACFLLATCLAYISTLKIEANIGGSLPNYMTLSHNTLSKMKISVL
jgi:hypothetical protein